MEAVVRNPAAFVDDALRGEFAKALLRSGRPIREAPAAWRQWGEGLEPEAVNQMGRACQLPVAVAGALMPDAHVGYGLPIGGVLATDNAVIPYAVGVDIACRMKLTVLDLPLRELDRQREQLIKAIEAETRFGVGATFKQRREHEVLDADWSVSPVTRQNKDRAWAQLGTSGSGNHFVEFGVFTATRARSQGLPAGEYVALLSHSGSRGTGAAVCDHYSKLAMAQHPDLPKEHKHLAWLSLDSAEGQEYWAAMELMGRYAAANHSLIHRHLARHLGLQGAARRREPPQLRLEGTPRDRRASSARWWCIARAPRRPGAGVLGIIPGSMATPGFLVRGKGNAASLKSASHGAGRVMSRTKAIETFEWDKVNRRAEGARREAHLGRPRRGARWFTRTSTRSWRRKRDLVEVLGRFDPKLVKMAPHGERPED